jgi:hypothetical protein
LAVAAIACNRRGRSRAAIACNRRGSRRSAGRRTDRESARSPRSPASGSSYSRDDPIRRCVPDRRRRANPVVIHHTRLLPLIHTPHQFPPLNTNPCIIGVLLLLNLLLPAAISSCVVVHIVDYACKLTCTFVP